MSKEDDEDEAAGSIGVGRYPCMPSLVALQQMRNRLHLAYLGKKLMKWTALATGRELRKIAIDLNESYGDFSVELANAYIMLARARYYNDHFNKMVIEDVQKKAEVYLTTTTKTVSGVKIFQYEITEFNQGPYPHLGIEKGGNIIMQAKRTWYELLKKMIMILQLRESFASVELAHKSATKKQNVLAKLIIPRLITTLTYILSELEEREREDIFRLKRFKQSKAKIASGLMQICYCCYRWYKSPDAPSSPVCERCANAIRTRRHDVRLDYKPCENLGDELRKYFEDPNQDIRELIRNFPGKPCCDINFEGIQCLPSNLKPVPKIETLDISFMDEPKAPPQPTPSQLLVLSSVPSPPPQALSLPESLPQPPPPLPQPKQCIFFKPNVWPEIRPAQAPKKLRQQQQTIPEEPSSPLPYCCENCILPFIPQIIVEIIEEIYGLNSPVSTPTETCSSWVIEKCKECDSCIFKNRVLQDPCESCSQNVKIHLETCPAYVPTKDEGPCETCSQVTSISETCSHVSEIINKPVKPCSNYAPTCPYQNKVKIIPCSKSIALSNDMKENATKNISVEVKIIGSTCSMHKNKKPCQLCDAVSHTTSVESTPKEPNIVCKESPKPCSVVGDGIRQPKVVCPESCSSIMAELSARSSGKTICSYSSSASRATSGKSSVRKFKRDAISKGYIERIEKIIKVKKTKNTDGSISEEKKVIIRTERRPPPKDLPKGEGSANDPKNSPGDDYDNKECSCSDLLNFDSSFNSKPCGDTDHPRSDTNNDTQKTRKVQCRDVSTVTCNFEPRNKPSKICRNTMESRETHSEQQRTPDQMYNPRLRCCISDIPNTQAKYIPPYTESSCLKTYTPMKCQFNRTTKCKSDRQESQEPLSMLSVTESENSQEICQCGNDQKIVSQSCISQSAVPSRETCGTTTEFILPDFKINEVIIAEPKTKKNTEKSKDSDGGKSLIVICSPLKVPTKNVNDTHYTKKDEDTINIKSDSDVDIHTFVKIKSISIPPCTSSHSPNTDDNIVHHNKLTETPSNSKETDDGSCFIMKAFNTIMKTIRKDSNSTGVQRGTNNSENTELSDSHERSEHDSKNSRQSKSCCSFKARDSDNKKCNEKLVGFQKNSKSQSANNVKTGNTICKNCLLKLSGYNSYSNGNPTSFSSNCKICQINREENKKNAEEKTKQRKIVETDSISCKSITFGSFSHICIDLAASYPSVKDHSVCEKCTENVAVDSTANNMCTSHDIGSSYSTSSKENILKSKPFSEKKHEKPHDLTIDETSTLIEKVERDLNVDSLRHDIGKESHHLETEPVKKLKTKLEANKCPPCHTDTNQKKCPWQQCVRTVKSKTENKTLEKEVSCSTVNKVSADGEATVVQDQTQIKQASELESQTENPDSCKKTILENILSLRIIPHPSFSKAQSDALDLSSEEYKRLKALINNKKSTSKDVSSNENAGNLSLYRRVRNNLKIMFEKKDVIENKKYVNTCKCTDKTPFCHSKDLFKAFNSTQTDENKSVASHSCARLASLGKLENSVQSVTYEDRSTTTYQCTSAATNIPRRICIEVTKVLDGSDCSEVNETVSKCKSYCSYCKYMEDKAKRDSIVKQHSSCPNFSRTERKDVSTNTRRSSRYDVRCLSHFPKSEKSNVTPATPEPVSIKMRNLNGSCSCHNLRTKKQYKVVKRCRSYNHCYRW